MKYWYSAVVKHSIRAAEHHKYYPSYKQTYCYYQTTAPHLIQILMEDSFTADPTGKFLPDVCLKIKKTMKIKILSSINFVLLIANLLYCEKQSVMYRKSVRLALTQACIEIYHYRLPGGSENILPQDAIFSHQTPSLYLL